MAGSKFSAACLFVCRLFGVFSVWLDDETLQKQEVYLPSLPPEYEPHRLAQVMQRHQVSIIFFNIYIIIYDSFIKCFCFVLFFGGVCRSFGWNMWTRSVYNMIRGKFCLFGRRCRVSQHSSRLKPLVSLTTPASAMVRSQALWPND